MIMFLDILKTNSVRHAGEVLKTMRIHKMPKIRGPQREYCSKPLKHSIGECILVFKR